jgi:hypothetical protein
MSAGGFEEASLAPGGAFIIAGRLFVTTVDIIEIKAFSRTKH